ncbi:TetR/AcrR family transcriptional regulator [Spirillospora sp. NPDC127200]
MARTRRTDTRERIQRAALDLFLDRGYDQTSLREIAERLDVTKAALYYHFKSKEEIVTALVEESARPVEELIAWAREQPPTLDTRRTIVRRLNEALTDGAPAFRFLHENQAALRGMGGAERSQERMRSLGELLTPPGADVRGQVRTMSALFAVYFGTFALEALEGGAEEKRAALLEVAEGLLATADGATSG